MKCCEFLTETLNEIVPSLYEEMLDLLISEKLIAFNFVEKNNITKYILAEKLNDYFFIAEQKSIGSGFDKMIDHYISDFDSIVKSGVIKAPKHKKKDTTPAPTPRARKYYDKAMEISKNNEISSIVDYSRIMMCLYVSIKKDKDNEILDFDYSVDCLDISFIISSMKNEKNQIGKKYEFKLDEMYSKDCCTFILLIVLYYYIKSSNMEE